jgi:outer membrane protein OmpA-like peptidoglycan-associated protein
MKASTMKIYIAASILVIFGSGSTVRAEQDCNLGQRYLGLAHERMAASENEAAAALLRQAIDACPSYEAYQSLGEIQAQSPHRDDRASAVDAFVSAHELAPSDKARARSLYSYARLLSRDGDPQNAYPLIRSAQTLDPTDPEIAQLSQQIEGQINNPSKDHIVRGLWNSLYKPLRMAAATTSDKIARPAPTNGPSANIPIYFETGTTLVDDQTRANVAILAHALADAAHPEQHFLFVGHADIRGSEANNVLLSKQRAETIYQAVILIEPSLQNRIEVTGRGSSEPIDPGHDERAYRANRRLQVLLK